jgi:hypothetical protein
MEEADSSEMLVPDYMASSQKSIILIFTAMRTLNPILLQYLHYWASLR